MAQGRYTLMIGAALLVSVATAYGAFRVLQAGRLGAQAATRHVVVAARDIPEGVTVERDAVTLAPWPATSAPAGAYPVADSVIGRVTRVPVMAGDPIVPARLAPVGSGPGLEVKIAPGRRAMAVKIDDVAGISGLVQPNSRVDVLVTLRPEHPQDRQVAKLFMENMRVLSVGTKVQRGDDGKPINATTATLEVTPDEAERLAVAVNQGSIQLVLRGYGDPDTVHTKGASSRDVLSQLRGGEVVPLPRASAPAASRAPRRATRPAAPRVDTVVVQSAPPAAPRRPDSTVVQIYRGDKVAQQTVPKADSARRPPR